MQTLLTGPWYQSQWHPSDPPSRPLKPIQLDLALALVQQRQIGLLSRLNRRQALIMRLKLVPGVQPVAHQRCFASLQLSVSFQRLLVLHRMLWNDGGLGGGGGGGGLGSIPSMTREKAAVPGENRIRGTGAGRSARTGRERSVVVSGLGMR